MLDRADACLKAVLDRPGPVGVRKHVCGDSAGDVDRGGQLLYGELRLVELVALGGGAPTGHHLDLVGPTPEHLPGGASHLVGPVRQDAFTRESAQPGKRPSRAPWARVAVASRLGDERSADQQSRPADESQPDRLLESPVEPARIAHRGEARLQGRLDLVSNPQGQHRGR